MTPNDIYTKKFDKAVGGYKAEDVNRFLIVMGDYLGEMIAERDELEDKLEVLAEKLEEYRADEESLRAAIVGAQKLGDSVVKESKHKAEVLITEARAKAEKIIADAQARAETLLDDTKNSIATEQYALERMKASVVKFRRQILSMYEQQVLLVNAIPFKESEIAEPEKPDFLKRDEKPDTAAHRKDTETGEAELVYEEEPDAYEANAETKRQSHFGPLLFGEDFSLTRKE